MSNTVFLGIQDGLVPGPLGTPKPWDAEVL
jgi:hypothetical protein